MQGLRYVLPMQDRQSTMIKQSFLSRNDVAQMLGVVPSTVTRWAKLGLLPTVVTVGGHHRYHKSDIQKLARELTKGRSSVGFRAIAEENRPVGTEGDATFQTEVSTTLHPPTYPHYGNGSVGLIEIRWHGRGGQGVVTASQILAEAAMLEDRYFQSFPEFGPERTGAPVRAFTRLSSAPITLHCPISHPNIVVVLDPTLLSTVDVFEGLAEGGIVVINSPLEPQVLKAKLPHADGWKLATVNATRIAMESFKRNVPNTPMLGALLKVAPVMSKVGCLQALQERLGARLAPEIVQANIHAFVQAYAEVQEVQL